MQYSSQFGNIRWDSDTLTNSCFSMMKIHFVHGLSIQSKSDSDEIRGLNFFSRSVRLFKLFQFGSLRVFKILHAFEMNVLQRIFFKQSKIFNESAAEWTLFDENRIIDLLNFQY